MLRYVSTVLVVVTLAALLQGCPPNPSLQPSLTVTRFGNVLVISGKGFANVPQCAHLSLESGAAGSRTIGAPSCSSGAFSDFPYPYSYGGCINPASTTNVTVFGVDTQGSNAAASLTIQIPWDTYCSLQAANCTGSGAACQACGGEGEPACNGTTCVQPPADGQPVCSNNACTSETCSYEQQTEGICTASYPDLHPTLSNPQDVNSQLICTANCGHTRGYSPCYPYMTGCDAESGVTYPNTITEQEGTCITSATSSTGLPLFSCYDNAVIDPDGGCTCLPSKGICPVNQSSGNGECSPANSC